VHRLDPEEVQVSTDIIAHGHNDVGMLEASLRARLSEDMLKSEDELMPEYLVYHPANYDSDSDAD